jgi:hypothetical protein
LPGLFPPRADAARQAVSWGLLERIRTEAKGKQIHEWVRVTPAGVRAVHDQDSPTHLLHEFHELFRQAQGEVPQLILQARAEYRQAAERFEARADAILDRLDGLADRLDAALRRMDWQAPLASGLQILVPWGAEALVYLDQRRAAGGAAECPLNELFLALRQQGYATLELSEFHAGLQRLQASRALTLLTAEGADVEYALLDGMEILTHATR